MKKWFALFASSFLFFFLLAPINVSRCAPELNIAGRTIEDQGVKRTQGSSNAQAIVNQAEAPLVRFAGGIILMNQLASGQAASKLPPTCTSAPALFGIAAHLIILSLILAQFVSYAIGHKILKLEDPTTFFSREYMTLFWGMLFKALLLAVLTWFITNMLFNLPFIAEWARVNTSIRSSGQAAVPFATLAFILPLAWKALRDELFSTVWERLFFFAEVILLLYEALFLALNIDLFLILLAIPFPNFSQEFDPFMPGQWKYWIRDFTPAPPNTSPFR
jgi:hypothetical protein